MKKQLFLALVTLVGVTSNNSHAIPEHAKRAMKKFRHTMTPVLKNQLARVWEEEELNTAKDYTVTANLENKYIKIVRVPANGPVTQEIKEKAAKNMLKNIAIALYPICVNADSYPEYFSKPFGQIIAENGSITQDRNTLYLKPGFLQNLFDDSDED